MLTLHQKLINLDKLYKNLGGGKFTNEIDFLVRLKVKKVELENTLYPYYK